MPSDHREKKPLGWQAYLDGGKILRGRNLADGKEKGLDNGF
jgi:hypothetical protein